MVSVDHGKTRRLQLGLRLTRSPPRCSVASDPGIYLQRGLARQACYSNDFDTVAGHAGWRIIYPVESCMKIDKITMGVSQSVLLAVSGTGSDQIRCSLFILDCLSGINSSFNGLAMHRASDVCVAG